MSDNNLIVPSRGGAATLGSATAGSVELQHDAADYKLKYRDSSGVLRSAVVEDLTQTLTNKTLTSPVINTPTTAFTTTGVTGTGATGGAGAVLPTATPAFVYATGASGSGVDLPTGPAGAAYFIANLTTGALNLYCVGGTINGVTGTTAVPITATGNRSAWAVNTSASGAWQVRGNT